MSIQSEINRIDSNIKASLEKIANRGVTIPEDANSDNLPLLIESIPSSGIDTSDATAGEYDIISPETAYVNGKKVTGAVPIIRGSNTAQSYPVMGYGIGPCVKMSYTPTEKQCLLPDSSFIDLCAPYSDFGDAMPEDVTAGKIFTSAAGLRVIGTSNGSGTSINLEEELAEQENLISQIKTALEDKASGGDAPSADGIPSGYSRVDFIEFTGSQLVDTGITGNQDTQITASFTWGNATQNHLFGCASSDNTASITSYMNGSWRFGDKSMTKTIAKNNTVLPYAVCVNKSMIGVTGSNSTISDVPDFETIGTMLLGGARSSSGALPSSGLVGRVFYFNIWQGDEQVMKLVPVVSDEGKYRFWDIISQTFFDSIVGSALGGGNL